MVKILGTKHTHPSPWLGVLFDPVGAVVLDMAARCTS